ncbi:ribbon-helix-helix domain-containing protein [Azospirillum himalayense]|uniref:Ribbon-helix-helix domain-containing protein n=1 Tax=Azospirillum himalayense TaxID=654847 RepID=A0ABW0GAR8_9PROT
MPDNQTPPADKSASSGWTKSHNIFVGGRRSSARMEPEFREALKDICDREKKSLSELYSEIDGRKRPDQTLSSATRVFTVAYFRNALHHIEEGSTD